MTMEPLPAPRRSVLPEDFDPPPGVRSLSIALYAGTRRFQRPISLLEDDQFAWLQRVVDAEQERRQRHLTAQRRHHSAGRTFVVVPPDGLQFVLF